MDVVDCMWVEIVLFYLEDIAGGLMNIDVIIICVDVDVDVVLCYLCMKGEFFEVIDVLYVIDDESKLIGYFFFVILFII